MVLVFIPALPCWSDPGPWVRVQHPRHLAGDQAHSRQAEDEATGAVHDQGWPGQD